MDDHTRKLQQFLGTIAGSNNSKVLSKEKYDNVVSHLSGSANSDSSAKFRWWIKNKGFQLLNFPELSLNDVLCVPAKKQVQSRYEGIPRCVVQEACRTCPVCLLSVKQTNNAELKPILSSGFLTRAQIDLIDMRHKPDGEYSYIAHYMDHWSKYHVIWPLKRKTADEVASGLNERVFPYLGLPRILHSDNGREFVNRVIREVVKDWGGEDVMFVNGRPRHSQSQGLVEQGNATIERHIANKRAAQGLTSDYPWASWLPKIQYNMNTEVAGGIKKTPYEVVFGQPPRTTIFPDAKVQDGVINEEDLPFDLNPNNTDEEVSVAATNTIEPPTETTDEEVLVAATNTIEPPTETTVTESLETDLPRIERPTPKPRKRRLNFVLLAEPRYDGENPLTAIAEEAATESVATATTTDNATILSVDQNAYSSSPPSDNRSNDASNTDTATASTDEEAGRTETVHTTELETYPNVASLDSRNGDAYVDHENSQISIDVEAAATETVSMTENKDSQNAPEPESILRQELQEEACANSQRDPGSKHFRVREEADANYKANAEKMKMKYSKRKRVIHETFTVGDFVTVRVPKIDRSSTDQPRLVAKVIKNRGTIDDSYKLQCKFGILDGWYRIGELMPYGQVCKITFDCEETISLREASRRENPNLIQRKKCMCQGPCSKNCYCVKNSLKCTSHCHPSKTCRNVEVATPADVSLQDRKIVNDGEELTDKHMLVAQQLLRKKFPSNNGFRDTLIINSRSAPEAVPYVQVLHVNSSHWVTIAASNSKGPVEVYDSLNPNKLSDSTLQTIRNFHGQSCIVKIMNIQKQKGYKDCGLFAIANATSLCHGDDPTALIYIQDEMRQHLLDCLEKKDMSPFPHEITLMKRRKRCRGTQSC